MLDDLLQATGKMRNELIPALQKGVLSGVAAGMVMSGWTPNEMWQGWSLVTIGIAVGWLARDRRGDRSLAAYGASLDQKTV